MQVVWEFNQFDEFVQKTFDLAVSDTVGCLTV